MNESQASITQDVIQAGIVHAFKGVAELQLLRAKKTLTTAEAAKLYGIGKNTLEQMRMNGEGPDYSQNGKGAPVLYTHEGMEAWLEKTRVRLNS